jgi:hypothetical protein
VKFATTAQCLVGTIVLVAPLTIVGCDSGTDPGGSEAPEIAKMWVEGPLTAPLGGTAQLEAFVLLKDGSTVDVTGNAAWDTLDDSIATVDRGLVAGVEVGVTEVRVRYYDVTFTDFLGVPNRGFPQGTITLEGYDSIEGTIQFEPGEIRQLRAEIRYPDATRADITDRIVWEESNPEAISVDELGVAEVHVSQGASELYAHYRGSYALAKLQVGDPLPKEYDVYVEAFKFAAPYSCDSDLNADGGDGEFNYEINVITLTGDRIWVAGTPDYPNKDEVITIEQNGSLLLESDQRHLVLSDIQVLEIEVRVTEWDLEFADIGAPVHDSDMDDMSVIHNYRGYDGFSPGVHTATFEGSVGNCEVEVSYRIIVRER